MEIVSICVSFIVAILGIAYPILFQVVSRLDEKYSSNLIIDLFNKEKPRKLFLIFLISSLASILIWTLKIPPLFQINGLNFLINNSALIFLSLNTITLIVFFFLFVEKILVYYTPTKFLKYLIKKHIKTKDVDNQVFFKAISDILIFSIKQQNQTIAKTISDFMYSAFQKVREENEGKAVEYPISYYEVIYKAIEELGFLENKKLKFLEYRTAGAIWLLGEVKNNKVSKTTYTWIWRNLLLAISYKKDDMVMDYWKNAHQFYSYQLQQIMPKYSYNPFKTLNEEEIKTREEERRKFLEFHYVLGGLLLYEKRYDVIGRVFKYTTSIPPVYELLPLAMGEVFQTFIQFRDPYETNYSWISHSYEFPNLDGLNSDGVIKYWITKYTALLYIRQYSIQPYLITMKPLELPKAPDEQGEKKKLIENLDFFEKLVKEVMQETELMEKAKLGFINKDWIEENQLPDPIELIHQYKSQLKKAFEKIEVQQDVSLTKLEQVKESSTPIISAAIKEYNCIRNDSIIEGSFNNWFIHGGRTVMEKNAFSDNNDVHHLNFDSFLASHIAKKFKYGISETFFYAKSDKYLLNISDVFKGIDKLKINSSDYVIVNFGNNLSYIKDQYTIDDLSDYKYKDIEIINFQESNHLIAGESLFILRKTDLPNIIYKDLDAEQIDKYSLELIDHEIKLYLSVVNLNKNEELRNELKPSYEDKDLNKSVLLNLSILTEIRWKKGVTNIMIQVNTPYRERGIPNSLKDVIEIKE
jgi:hypothetical protein